MSNTPHTPKHYADETASDARTTSDTSNASAPRPEAHDEQIAQTPASDHETHGTPTDQPAEAGASKASEKNTASESGGHKQPPLLAFIIGLPIVLCLMLLAFVSPTIHSGAKDLPLAVSGPKQAVAQVTGQLEKAKPGAFDVKTYDNAAAGADAIKNRDAVGGISVGKDGVTIQTAAGAGTPYIQVLKGIGAGMAEKGQKVHYSELAPLPKKDPMGTVMTSAGLPLIFGGMATSAALFFGFRGSFGRRSIGVIGVATLGGLAAAAVLRYWMHGVDCSYWMLALAFGLGIAAIAFTVIGLAKNLGPAGFGLGALLMLFISNPISAMATGPQWLPHPWGTIGQFLPVGAAGTVLRSVAYFDSHGATRAWIVLVCWAAVGFVLLSLGRLRRTHH